jgi:hypothetical protein
MNDDKKTDLVGSQLPLFPRSAWKNKEDFLKVMIATKKALDREEIIAMFR